MNIFWAMCVFLVVLNIALLPFVAKELAARDWFFTLVQEGTAKAVMGPGGKGFKKFVMQYAGHRFVVDPRDGSRWLVKPDSTTENWFKNYFGLVGVKWIGIPMLRTIYKYKFEWNSLKQSAGEGIKESGGIYFKPHEEVIDYIILQHDVYYARIEEAEDSKMVPLNFDIVIKAQVNNPYKALFGVQSWLEMAWGLVLPEWRTFIQRYQWHTLSKRTKRVKDKFLEIQDDEIGEMDEKYGVVLADFRVLRVQPAGKRAEMYEAAATAAFEADAEAKKTIIGAKAEAEKLVIGAKAEQERIQTVYGEVKALGELGEMVRRLEAFEKAASGAGNMIVSAPELTAMFKKLAGISASHP